MKESLYAQFVEEVVERWLDIDPSEEQDWYSLSLGWALAKGLSPSEAHDFSVWARYTKHYEV